MALGSPRTAVATARQRSMSNPMFLPERSRYPQPGTSFRLAQMSLPRSLTILRRLLEIVLPFSSGTVAGTSRVTSTVTGASRVTSASPLQAAGKSKVAEIMERAKDARSAERSPFGTLCRVSDDFFISL